MSMGLNRSHVTPEMIDAWSDTRLVIIDECSFASVDQVNKMEKHARDLKKNAFHYYGGLSVVFAGSDSQENRMFSHLTFPVSKNLSLR